MSAKNQPPHRAPPHPPPLPTRPNPPRETSTHITPRAAPILLFFNHFQRIPHWTGYPLHHACSEAWLREHEKYDRDHSWSAFRPKTNGDGGNVIDFNEHRERQRTQATPQDTSTERTKISATPYVWRDPE